MMRAIIFSLIFSLGLFASSCTISRDVFGNYARKQCTPKVYKKGKDIYLFWDNLHVRKTEKNLKLKDYEKVVKRNFFDSVVYFGTMGIFSFYTVKIKTKDCDEELKSTPSHNETH